LSADDLSSRKLVVFALEAQRLMDAFWLRLLPKRFRTRFREREELQAVLNNSGWLAADRLMRLIIGMPITIWIARYLGPNSFGLLNYAIAFVAIFAALAAAGLDRIVVRELVRSRKEAGSILATAFAIRLALALIAFAAAVVAASTSAESDPRAFWLIVVIATGMVIQTADVIDYWNQAHLQSELTVRAKMAGFLVASTLRIWMILSNAPLLAFALVSLTEITIGAAILIVTHFNAVSGDTRYQFSLRRARHLLGESWPLLIAGIAVTLYMRVDIVMLQSMTDAAEVGIYASAVRLSEVWYAVPVILASSAYPAIVRSRASQPEQYLSRVRRLYFTLFWLAILICLPASIFSGWLVSTLYGASFVAAGPVLAIHLWGSIGVFLGVASSQHLLAENLQMISMYRTAIGLVSNVLLNLFLIPKYQAQGAAIATVISYLIATFSIAFFKKTRSHAIYLLISPIYKG
jgi:PST family polysaccharide transporter